MEEDKAQQSLQVVFHPGIRHRVFMVFSAQVDMIYIDVALWCLQYALIWDLHILYG